MIDSASMVVCGQRRIEINPMYGPTGMYIGGVLVQQHRHRHRRQETAPSHRGSHWRKFTSPCPRSNWQCFEMSGDYIVGIRETSKQSFVCSLLALASRVKPPTGEGPTLQEQKSQNGRVGESRVRRGVTVHLSPACHRPRSRPPATFPPRRRWPATASSPPRPPRGASRSSPSASSALQHGTSTRRRPRRTPAAPRTGPTRSRACTSSTSPTSTAA